MDPAFSCVDINKPGFFIWRVEKMEIRAQNKNDYGKFYRGDSYIVYHCGVSSSRRGPLEVHIHFWLGSETTADEAGVAAYKTVELDNYLGGSPVQHREVENSESAKFKSYFRDGIRYLEGGIESGMKHVSSVFEPKMYLVKGKRRPTIRQLVSVNWRHINDGDVFVIDTKSNIFVWTGKRANNMEKIQGARLAQTLKSEHGGGRIVIVESEEENLMVAEDRECFDKILPLKERSVLPAGDDQEDAKQDKRISQLITLYQCCDESGQLEVTKVKNGPLVQSDLSSKDSFIIDNGDQGVWVWIGKSASKRERSEGMVIAQKFIEDNGYEKSTRVTRVIDGGESNEFKSLFKQWNDVNAFTGLSTPSPAGNIAKVDRTTFNAASLHSNIDQPAQNQMPDDGGAEKEVWRVEKFSLIPVQPEAYGIFYSGDCYVVMYKYRSGGREKIIIYFWLGAQSSAEKQGTAALKARELDDKHGGTPIQVRVVQGKEPAHFLAMFGGRIIVYSGGVTSAFDGPNSRSVQIGDSYMLQVRSTSGTFTRAIQVDLKASSLNSNDCFVIKAKTDIYIWCGEGSSTIEQQVAQEIAEQTKAKVTSVKEGQEPDNFWQILGGKQEYSSDSRLKESIINAARLFQCSNASGRFKVEEIFKFDQSDLIEDDVMLLDAWNAIFLWIGRNSNNIERNESQRVAVEYLKADPAGRDPDTPILKVKQNHEPLNFTGYFGVWSSDFWSNQPTWSQIKEQVAPLKTASVQKVDEGQKKTGTTFTLDELKSMVDPPDFMDVCRKEEYLNDQDFRKIFQMSKDEFIKLPLLKKIEKKRNVGLS